MNFNEIWEEICFLVKKHRNDSEKEFQIVAESIFEKLDWKQFRNEIVKPTINLGAANKGIPDLVIQKDNIPQYVVELKKVGIGISDRNVEQLVSYMRQLKLTFGVLLGATMQLYYDIPEDNQKAKKICEIPFESNIELGPKVIKLLSKEHYDKNNFQNFCEEQINIQSLEVEHDKQVNFLCSSQGVDYIKELLEIEYSKDVISKIDITIKRKNEKPFILTTQKNIKSFSPKLSEEIPNIIISNGNLSREQNESIQNWVKRVLIYLMHKNLLTDNEIQRLHNLEYSKNTFGITFPLLCDNENEIIYTGHSRYWTKWKLNNQYYVCSQWWKEKFDEYEYNINKWIKRFLNVSK